jgi:hypothetical protein
VGDCFHHDFQVGFWTDMCKYIGGDLGCTTWVQQQARMWARAK